MAPMHRRQKITVNFTMSALKSGVMRASLTASRRRSNTQEESAMVMKVMAEVVLFPQALGDDQRKI